MRTSAIHLAERFVGDGTGFVLKKYAVFGQHRDLSDAVVPASEHPMRRVNVELT